MANGISFSLADAVIAPSIVLPLFINHLTPSHVLVGLPPAIISAGWLLPQLFIASRVQHLPRMMPWYNGAGVVRLVCMALQGITIVLLGGDQPALLLASFFSLYTIYSLAAGVAGIPWLEAVSKTIAPRRRGTFFGTRNFLGGSAAFLMSVPVSQVLRQGDAPGALLPFPLNFALLFGVSALFVAGGAYSWSRVFEPAIPPSAPRSNLWAQIRRGPQIVRTDRDYRAFFVARLLLAGTTIAGPFYVVYAREVLHAPAELVGFYLAALTVSGVLSNLVWSPLADRTSTPTMMRLNAAAVGSVPILALALVVSLARAGPAWAQQAPLIFSTVFILSGFASGAGPILNNNLLLTIAPAAERPLYIGFLNTVLGIATLVPILGGTLVDRFGYTPVFVFSALLAACAFLVGGKLTVQRAR
ncbi:MAG TPA: MFS transporter [Chloroflexia bacterium]|nr:MFS transporter [Chloroflexia bacterium]